MGVFAMIPEFIGTFLDTILGATVAPLFSCHFGVSVLNP